MKLMSQQLIKDTNLKQIYNCIFQNRGISRATLAKQMHLSKTTISSLVDELIARGFIIDSGTDSGTTTVGRKPNSLEVCSARHYILVLRLEECYIDVHLVDLSGVSTPVTRREVRKDDSYVDLSRSCVDDLFLTQVKREQILGICFVVPAMIDMEQEEIYATTLQFSDGDAMIVSKLKSTFHDYSVAILNDTACFAYAEKVFAHIHERDFAFINFDRGIGATLFIHDEMLGRASASYTQFGHYSVDPLGKSCPCGNRGCLELMIGETSLQERLNALPFTDDKKVQTHVTYAELGRAALHGDENARQVICDIAKQFAQALSNLICTIHPKRIIIGGKGHDLGTLFLEECKKSIAGAGFRRMTDSIDICFSLLDSNACFPGAMKYFFDIHYQFSDHATGNFFLG